MTNQVFESSIIALVKSALNGTCAEISKDFDWEKAYLFAKSQSLIPLVYYGVVNSKIKIPEVFETKLNNAVLTHFLYDQKQQFEVARIQNAFEENAIDYMPIKGVLLRHLYPKTEMRPMGDADIMIREEQRDKIANVMESLGYGYSYETAHEWVFNKGDVVIELHKCFIPPRTKDYYEYYKDSWSFAKKVAGNKNRYEMSDEDHLVYLVTHFAKHYRAGGIGVLHMADFYLFLKNKELNNKYIREEFEKLQLLKFYDNVVTTIENWFNGGPAGERTRFITHRIFSNGLWGTGETRTMAAAVRTTKSTFKIRQFFPRLEGMKLRYPVLKKHPYLLPFTWVARWFDLLIFKRDRMRVKLQRLEQTTDEKVSAYHDELHYVGLDFNYEE